MGSKITDEDRRNIEAFKDQVRAERAERNAQKGQSSPTTNS